MGAQQATVLPLGGSIQRDEIYLPFESPSGENAMSSRGLEQKSSGDAHAHADAIDTEIVTIDGEDKILYIVKSTKEQFSSRKDALEAHLVEKKIITLDGEDSIVYIVKSTGDQYSTREKALTAAAKAPPLPPPKQKQQQKHPHPAGNDNGTQIGDVRIRFSEVACYTVSILGQLQGKFLSSWPSPEGAGYDVNILTRGQVSAAGMVETWQTNNWYMTWGKRFAGWLLAFLGFGMVTSIISTAADVSLGWIPFLGPMTVSIISLGVTIANFTLACTTSFLVAGLSWVVYRPFWGSVMLAGSVGIFYFVAQSGEKQGGAARSEGTPDKTKDKNLRLAKLDPIKEMSGLKAKPY